MSQSSGDAGFSGPGVGVSTRAGRMALVGCGVVVAGLLAAMSTVDTTFAVLALAAALGILLLAVLGRERVIALVMMAVFATAPMYKGIAPNPGSTITPTDILFGLALILLLPTFLTRRLTLPPLYWLGLLVITTTGAVASAASEFPVGSLINLIQWLVVLAGLPVLYVMWRPSAALIRVLLWFFIAGHMASTAYAVVDGKQENDRYLGLTHHENAFAEAGLIVVAICLYLFSVQRTLRARLVIVGAAAVGVESILMSGSRSSLLVVAVLVVMVPIVERSAISGFFFAILGSLFIFSLPLLVGIAGEGSALSRLEGSLDAKAADTERTKVNEAGWAMFTDKPLLGNGYIDDVFLVHNNVLEIAAASGIFALFGYAMVMYVLARPLFGSNPHRRLCYCAWAYLGLGLALPGLWDRTIWVPLALSILPALGLMHEGTDPVDDDREEGDPALPVSGTRHEQ